MIYITGDTHGRPERNLSFKQFKDGKELTKDDYVIICGDFGLLWSNLPDGDSAERRNIKWLNDKPWTTLFIDGNHENFSRLAELEDKNMFGSKVGVVADSIYHLRRGEVYEIDGKDIFCFGGGYSIDKDGRVPDITWWSEEMPTTAEYEYGFKELEKKGNRVDYVITHTCSHMMFEKLLCYYPRDLHPKVHGEDAIRMFFNLIEERVKFKRWFFGHFHVNRILDDNHIALLDKVVRIT